MFKRKTPLQNIVDKTASDLKNILLIKHKISTLWPLSNTLTIFLSITEKYMLYSTSYSLDDS